MSIDKDLRAVKIPATFLWITLWISRRRKTVRAPKVRGRIGIGSWLIPLAAPQIEDGGAGDGHGRLTHAG